jgi:hypothetical protein
VVAISGGRRYQKGIGFVVFVFPTPKAGEQLVDRVFDNQSIDNNFGNVIYLLCKGNVNLWLSY